MLDKIKNLFKKSDKKEKFKRTRLFNEGETCAEIIGSLHRPFSTCDLKHYPHHGLYHKWRWDGAVSNTKGRKPTVPCGLGNDKPKETLYVHEIEYEIEYNVMKHKTTLSDGRTYNSIVTFPKTTDSYLFSGIVEASHTCADNALKKNVATDLEITFN